MVNHLRLQHKINTFDIEKLAELRTNALFDHQQLQGKTESEKKSLMARGIGLWCCIDLLPFSVVSGAGFRWWTLNNGYIKSVSELPDERTVATSALNDLCVVTESRFKELVKLAPRTILIQLDFWTSNNGNTPFITIALVFLDQNFKLHVMTLTTEKFDRPHTAERTAAVGKKQLEGVELGDRQVILSGDHGSNVKTLPNHMNSIVSYFGCLGHTVHLIYSSDLPKLECFQPVDKIVKKMKAIHGTLCYQLHDLKTYYQQAQRQDIELCLQQLEECFEILRADEDVGGNFDEDYTNEMLIEHYGFMSNGLEQFSSFAKWNVTRWTSQYEMIRTFDKNFGK